MYTRQNRLLSASSYTFILVVSANLLRRLYCQCGGGRFLSPSDPLLAPLRDLGTLLRDKYRRPLVPPMCPVAKITESEHRDDMSARVLEEVALLDAELAHAGTEPEEGEAEDGAEQGHGCRIIGRHSDRW